MTIRLALSASAIVALAGAVRAQHILEVSEDAQLTTLIDTTQPQRPQSERGVGVPYNTTPDWTLNLRRQVGAVRVADMNNDGRKDLVVGCYISSSFPPYDNWQDMIFYNTGTTLEAAPSWISADQVHTGDIQIGDINLDGHLDVFAINGSFAQQRIYFGSPSGPSTTATWFSAPPQSSWATSGLLFDIDGDNDLDALTTNQATDPNPYRPMYFYRNNNGVLDTVPSWQSAEASIQNTSAAIDYDNDGDLDVAVSKWVNFQSGIYRNNNGTLETTPVWTTGLTGGDRGVAVDDVDENNFDDVVIGRSPSALYENNAGVLTFAYSIIPTFSSVQENTFCDVDQDGDKDYAEVHFGNGVTHIYLTEGGAVSQGPSWTFDATEVANAIAFGDINSDGWDDLVVGYSGNTSIRIFFAVPPPPPNCPGDANGDLVVDAADLSVLLGQFGTSVSPGTGADFNGDGDVNSADLSVLLSAFGTAC